VSDTNMKSDDNTIYYSPKSTVLLTGAGFSKPFGGYLAGEMWELIFNQEVIAQSPRIRELLLKELNYERAYERVVKEFKPSEKVVLTEALRIAYAALDHAICTSFKENRRHIEMVRSFVRNFRGEDKKRGFVFTLNQDLLLERYCSMEEMFKIPGPEHHDWFTPRLGDSEPPIVKVPDVEEVNKLRNKFWSKQSGLERFLYIKLHGSYCWQSEKNKDCMVIGCEKEGRIADEPLLAWYFDIFKEVLSIRNQTLVVVGYGFMDRHINNIIADSRKSGLRLCVISPLIIENFRNRLCNTARSDINRVHRGKEIWKMIWDYQSKPFELGLPNTFFTKVGLS